MASTKGLAAAAAGALALQPIAVQAQPACVTQAEVTAIAIYSVPSLVQAMRLRCGDELSASGYIARRGDALSGRYAALQPQVWPRAKSGMLKVIGAQPGAGQGRQMLDSVGTLPDEAVRPLVDAWIVQETSARIPVANCQRIEWVVEALAPVEPEVAGGLIGALVGLVDSGKIPICPRRA
ncbi:MAG TPA: hypothetical protein VFS49_05645 [Croceibacterium sp.]|nr:hypothetical protein [Croceibacterium sp.]